MNKITFRGETDEISSYVMIEYEGVYLFDIDFRGMDAGGVLDLGEIIGVDIL